MARYMSYWLVPAAEPRAYFQDLIEILARSHEAPSFAPHVTIYSGESPTSEDPHTVIAQSTGGVREVQLQIDTILYTDLFSKSLFVQFHHSEQLSRITERMRRISAQPSAYDLNPHLSLVYKNMPADDKRNLISGLQLPKSDVLFDEVWGIVSTGSPSAEEDVKSWEVLCRASLRGEVADQDMGTG